MNRKIVINENSILILFALTFFMTDTLYLNTNWYGNVAVKYLITLITTISILMLMYLGYKNDPEDYFKLTPNELLFLAITIGLRVYIGVCGTTGHIALSYGDFKFILFLYAIVKLSDVNKAKVFQYVCKAFAILMIPGLIYFIICNLGLQNIFPNKFMLRYADALPIDAQYYHVFPLGVVMKSNSIFRFCGIYDEPGVVGTFSALLYIGSYKRIEKKWSRLIFLEGILSFSAAFMFLIVIFYIIKNVIEKKFRVVLVLAIALISYFLIINIHSDNFYIRLLQEKINITTISDRRFSGGFVRAFNNAKRDGGISWWFGHGRNESSKVSDGSFTYKMVIWDYGLIGTIVYFGTFIIIQFIYGTSITWPFIICLLASAYQRPYIFEPPYLMIAMCGIAFVKASTIQSKNHLVENDGIVSE